MTSVKKMKYIYYREGYSRKKQHCKFVRELIHSVQIVELPASKLPWIPEAVKF